MATLLDSLPHELEAIVLDYKAEFEKHERKQRAIDALVSVVFSFNPHLRELCTMIRKRFVTDSTPLSEDLYVELNAMISKTATFTQWALTKDDFFNCLGDIEGALRQIFSMRAFRLDASHL